MGDNRDMNKADLIKYLVQIFEEISVVPQAAEFINGRYQEFGNGGYITIDGDTMCIDATISLDWLADKIIRAMASARPPALSGTHNTDSA
jgi:hypothetical protein